LGPSSAGLLTFDRALYTASRSVGAPFLPHDPAPTSAVRQPRGGADETLGLQVPAPIQWLLDKAERRQGGSEDSAGTQTREAVTTGKLLKPPGSGTGEYQVQLSEKFTGDPCPKQGGIVEGTAIYTVDREATLLPGVVNVATITVSFKAKVSKAATITSYDLTAKLTSAEGGWSGAIDGKGLTPDRIPGPKQLSGFTVSAPSTVNPTTQGQLEAAVRQALFRAKEDVDKWLKASQEIFKDKAKCTKVSGNNLGALRPGQTREIELDVRSIRGSRTDDGIQVTGRNGLQVISPTGKATATNGKLKVQVRGTKRHSQALHADVTSYLLDVQSESELGRGLGTLELPRIGGYRFKGTLRENDFTQFGKPAGRTTVDFHLCGDPTADPWTGQLTYVSEGDVLTFDDTWTFTPGAYTTPVDQYGNHQFFAAGSLDFDVDPPQAHFQLTDFAGNPLTPTLEITQDDSVCPPR
jgi:hypothetical protein